MNSLQQLLEDGVRFDPHYQPSMNSDHLPMTLCAMSALGADDVTLYTYRDDYSKILQEITPARPLVDWHDGIGKLASYPALLAFMRGQIDRRGALEVVREILPVLAPGLAADAFHPVIRLGYALDFESAAEVAAALAYMVSTAITVPIDEEHRVDLGEALQRQAATPLRLTGGRFPTGLRQLRDQQEYPTAVAGGFAECAARALDVYRGTRNFFALHMVTASQAVRVCSTVVDPQLMLASLTGALLAAHRIVGSPGFDADRPMPIPERLDREHNFKYVYACASEYRAFGDARYLEEIRGFRAKGLVPEWAGRDLV